MFSNKYNDPGPTGLDLSAAQWMISHSRSDFPRITWSFSFQLFLEHLDNLGKEYPALTNPMSSKPLAVIAGVGPGTVRLPALDLLYIAEMTRSPS